MRLVAGLALAVFPILLGAVPAQVDWSRARTFDARRGTHACVYDATRERLVLFGEGTTSEWDGQEWIHSSPVQQPGPRVAHAVAYDLARQRVVLFGGVANGGLAAETWEWSGTGWTSRQHGAWSGPSGRWLHAMTYDAARERTLLFGGYDGTRLLDDTWEWDGAQWWLRRSSRVAPLARTETAMAYDASRGRVVMFGGKHSHHLADTWEWDGTDWIERKPATVPPAHAGHAMVYDAARRRVVMFGGLGLTSPQIWEWDGIDWRLVASTGAAPSPRYSHAMAFDVKHQLVLLVGGRSLASQHVHTDMWAWNGRGWSMVAGDALPSGREGHALGTDDARRQVVLFGGSDRHSRVFSDTWTWDGARWTERRPSAGAPPARTHHAIAPDSARQELVLFGGGTWLGGSGSLLDDTWVWDGAGWSPMHPPVSPTARVGHAMAGDAARGRVVLFGGLASGQALLGDTWEWDGGTWQQLHVTPSPAGSRALGMTYDAHRRRCVLVRGAAPQVETWEWDGVRWIDAQPIVAPPGFTAFVVAYDEHRRRVVFVAQPLGETWEWNGAVWSKSPGAPITPHRDLPAIAYDPVRRQMLLFGGANELSFMHGALADTWVRGAPRATAQPFGSGCGNAASAPVLAGSEPYIGAPACTLELSRMAVGAPALIGVSLHAQNQDLGGGCTLYLQGPIAPFFVTANPLGFASARFAIPADVGLRGARLHAQGFVADPQGPVLGMSFTAGRKLVVGD